MAATSSSSGWRALISGSTLPQFTPTRMAQSCSRATSARNRTFSAHRLLLLVVVEVAGVVADLVHVGRHLRGQPVVLLQVHDQVGAWSAGGSRPAPPRPWRCPRPPGRGRRPASRMASACSTVASTSWVRVAHMLCTATGWAAPRVTAPTRTAAGGVPVDVHRGPASGGQGRRRRGVTRRRRRSPAQADRSAVQRAQGRRDHAQAARPGSPRTPRPRTSSSASSNV